MWLEKLHKQNKSKTIAVLLLVTSLILNQCCKSQKGNQTLLFSLCTPAAIGMHTERNNFWVPTLTFTSLTHQSVVSNALKHTHTHSSSH